MHDFTSIEYLKSGNKRQQLTYQVLKELKIFDTLKSYHPILTGTIPIDIDTPESDLDIICECNNHEEFAQKLTELFAAKENFEISTKDKKGLKSTVARFKTKHFIVEIFGQNIPTKQQNAYRHMLIEAKILHKMGAKFKAEIKKLKRKGIKTEPAFARLLGINGDPYEELLKFNP